MAEENHIFNIIVTEDYTNKNGEVKTLYHQVGTGFSTKKGGMRCKLPPGIALCGDFLILPRTSKAADDGPTPDPEEGHEIPY